MVKTSQPRYRPILTIALTAAFIPVGEEKLGSKRCHSNSPPDILSGFRNNTFWNWKSEKNQEELLYSLTPYLHSLFAVEKSREVALRWINQPLSWTHMCGWIVSKSVPGVRTPCTSSEDDCMLSTTILQKLISINSPVHLLTYFNQCIHWRLQLGVANNNTQWVGESNKVETYPVNHHHLWTQQ